MSLVPKLKYFLPLALAIFVLDQWTKGWIESFIAYRSAPHPVWGTVFQLANERNPGGMWSIGTQWPHWILLTVRIGAVFVIAYLLAQTPNRDRLTLIALGLVMGGAAGNITDSIRFEYVRDFLRFDFGIPVFHPFPTFNVADSAICIGVGLLAIQMLRAPPEDETGAVTAGGD